MFIISCILSVTKMSHNELAEFVSITEDMISDYLAGSEIPKKIKERFATIFSFPSFYFDVDTSNDKYFEHIMRETIKKEWENNKPKKYRHKVTEKEIVDCLLNGYDLITHKKFDDEHILNNKDVKKFLKKILSVVKVNNAQEEIIDDIIYPDKNNNNNIIEEDDIHAKLIEWRKKRSIKENMKEFMIISDRVINNILDTPINEQKDLLKVSGIGLATYGKYGDEIYAIVKDKDKKEVEVLEI